MSLVEKERKPARKLPPGWREGCLVNKKSLAKWPQDWKRSSQTVSPSCTFDRFVAISFSFRLSVVLTVGALRFPRVTSRGM